MLPTTARECVFDVLAVFYSDACKCIGNLMGDGAFGMSGTDIETAARSGFAITTVLVNNSSMATYAGAAQGIIGPEARQFPTTGEHLPSLVSFLPPRELSACDLGL